MESIVPFAIFALLFVVQCKLASHAVNADQTREKVGTAIVALVVPGIVVFLVAYVVLNSRRTRTIGTGVVASPKPQRATLW